MFISIRRYELGSREGFVCLFVCICFTVRISGQTLILLLASDLGGRNLTCLLYHRLNRDSNYTSYSFIRIKQDVYVPGKRWWGGVN